MFNLGIIFVLVGIALAVFNKWIAFRIFGGRRHDEFLSSVSRQNIAIVGGAFIFGGLLMIYLS